MPAAQTPIKKITSELRFVAIAWLSSGVLSVYLSDHSTCRVGQRDSSQKNYRRFNMVLLVVVV